MSALAAGTQQLAFHLTTGRQIKLAPSEACRESMIS
jgi:hypothetical protein